MSIQALDGRNNQCYGYDDCSIAQLVNWCACGGSPSGNLTWLWSIPIDDVPRILMVVVHFKLLVITVAIDGCDIHLDPVVSHIISHISLRSCFGMNFLAWWTKSLRRPQEVRVWLVLKH